MQSNSTQEKRVLLIGGGGYIGPVIANLLLDSGYQVRALDCFVYRHNRSVLHLLSHPRYELSYGDLSNPKDLSEALAGVAHVVVLGGLVGDPITKKYPGASEAINDRGIKTCIDQLSGKGLDRVVFVSTCSNYGMMPEGQIAHEESPVNPLSLYAKAKVEGERHLLDQRGRVDYKATILRFATAFGLAPRMRFDLTVNEFARDLANGKEIVVYDADTWRPYCHVKDFARLIKMVLEADSSLIDFEIFNVGGDANNSTKRGIIERISRLIPVKGVTYQENGSDPRNYRVDFSKIRSRLDFEPSFDIDYGIKEIVAACRHGIFDDVKTNLNYFGNYELFYPEVQGK